MLILLKCMYALHSYKQYANTYIIYKIQTSSDKI